MDFNSSLRRTNPEFDEASISPLARHDNGPQYLTDHFQNELAYLGIKASPSFVREPEGNGMMDTTRPGSPRVFIDIDIDI